MSLTSGWKTYAAAAACFLVAGLKIAGVDMPGFETVEPGPLFVNGLGLLGLRMAVGKLA